jgi:hypothetical protein
MGFDRLEADAFWRDLMPDLSVHAVSDQALPVLRPDAAAADTMRGVFDREGYIQLPRSQDIGQMARLARRLDAIRASGLPPVFSFIYDEMWQPFRRLGPVLDCLLRGPHAIMPNLWAWHVDPSKDEAGWPPHRDKPGLLTSNGQLPRAISVWIPLTEATPLNGCMYVLPRHRDPDYGGDAAGTLTGDVADVRALPAIPGDSLVWTQSLLHWGSRTSALATEPRLSMSVEFQRLDEPALADFVILPGQHLTFEQKLALIGRGIVAYQHMHRLDRELTDAARRWRARVPDLFGLVPAAAAPAVLPGLPGARGPMRLEDLLSRR